MSRFGEYLKLKRVEKNISIRSMARDLKVSVSYISELESGVKMPPNSKEEKYNNLIEKISNYLQLDDVEYENLRSLADSELGSRGYLSNDMTDYINNVPLAMVALRKAKDVNLSENDWNKIIENMSK